MKRFQLFIPIAIIPLCSIGQKKLSPEDYIEKYSEFALQEMQIYKIPASITLAQGLLESGFGNSNLATKANNHFGIKCGSWKGETYFADDDLKNECFRKYKNAAESFKDHSQFLSLYKRYEDLFKLEITDYKGWARGLKKAGYATDPKYAEALIKLIEDYKLYEYDSGAIPKTKTKYTGYNLICHLCNRKIYTNNAVPFVIADSTDNPLIIAKEFDMGAWQIFRYNDMQKSEKISTGDTIYLKPKKRKASVELHTVKTGETIHAISQKYAIKEKHIFRINEIKPETPIKAGQKLYLQKRKMQNKKVKQYVYGF